MTFNGPIGGLIEFTISGGWGSEVPKENHSRVAVIRGTDIPKVISGDFSSVPFRYESDKKILNRILAPGDVVLETAGGSSANGQYTGRTLLVTQEILDALGPTICASFCKKLVLKKELVSPSYFYLYMQDLYKSGRVASYDSQSTGISNFQYEAFVNNELLELPPLENQTSVATTLSNLQSKINNNSQISKTLEVIAQTLFESWFLDFDPVKAKMAGEKPVGMDAVTAALFPDSMEESELGLIPKDWRIGKIKEICSIIVNGSTPLRSVRSYWDLGTVPWFKTGELVDGFVFDSKECITELGLSKSSAKILPANSVLIALYGATIGRLGVLTSDASFNQAATGMTASDQFGYPFLFLSLLEKRQWFIDSGVGAAQQNISKEIVENAELVLPSNRVLEKFNETALILFNQIRVLNAQNLLISKVRDSLLPRLISGELQIPKEMLAS
jgi:type I restriction enzyme S subunit